MYGVTKLCCERLGKYFNRRFGIDFRCARVPAVTGPRRALSALSIFTSLMIQEPALRRPYEVYVIGFKPDPKKTRIVKSWAQNIDASDATSE
jgi:nucleoside-diphosphate-sugar epimerase